MGNKRKSPDKATMHVSQVASFYHQELWIVDESACYIIQPNETRNNKISYIDTQKTFYKIQKSQRKPVTADEISSAIQDAYPQLSDIDPLGELRMNMQVTNKHKTKLVNGMISFLNEAQERLISSSPIGFMGIRYLTTFVEKGILQGFSVDRIANYFSDRGWNIPPRVNLLLQYGDKGETVGDIVMHFAKDFVDQIVNLDPNKGGVMVKGDPCNLIEDTKSGLRTTHFKKILLHQDIQQDFKSFINDLYQEVYDLRQDALKNYFIGLEKTGPEDGMYYVVPRRIYKHQYKEGHTFASPKEQKPPVVDKENTPDTKGKDGTLDINSPKEKGKGGSIELI